MEKHVAVSCKLYADLAKNIKAESVRILSYFIDQQPTREEIEPIFDVIVAQLELVEVVARRVPTRELERVRITIQELDSSMKDLHEEYGIQDIGTLYQVKRILQSRAQELERCLSPISPHKRQR